MVTDMQRLERAARLSMGAFEPEAEDATVPRKAYPLKRLVALLAAFTAILVACAVAAGFLP